MVLALHRAPKKIFNELVLSASAPPGVLAGESVGGTTRLQQERADGHPGIWRIILKS